MTLVQSPPDAEKSRIPTAVRLRGGGRDLRLVAGVVLVLLSVVLGARLVATADQRVEAWSLAGPLAAGSTLTTDDLVAVPVGLDDTSAYLAADLDVVGQVLLRDVGAGELLPAAAVGEPDAVPRRLVTVPVDPAHAPPGLARGERVDVWVSPSDGGSVTVGRPQLVLASVLVADPGSVDGTGLSDSLAVVLDVPESDAGRAVAAARTGDVDLVRVAP